MRGRATVIGAYWGAILFATVSFVATTVHADKLRVESIVSQPTAAEDFFVRWKAGTPASVMKEYYQRSGMRPVWRSTLVWGLERLAPTSPAVERFNAVTMLRNDSHVMYVEPNFRVHRTLRPMTGHSDKGFMPLESVEVPNDPLFTQQWALTEKAGINMQEAWKTSHGSRNIKVAVIDTGVDSSHPEMKGKLADGYDFIDKTNNVRDDHGHGTHCAGVIGANTNNNEGIAGINPDVTIIPIRVVPSDGDETDADVISGFEFAVKAGAQVASCSFGKAKSSQAVGDVIAAAGDHGLLAVVAAGNDGADLNEYPSYPASFQTKNMIVVAANGSKGDLASFSNYGKGKVDLAAPGSAIISSIKNGEYDSWSGTSMATPHVAGVAALVLSVKPDLSPMQVKDIILKSVQVDSKLKTRLNTGGRLDAAAAVKAAAQLRGFSR